MPEIPASSLRFREGRSWGLTIANMPTDPMPLRQEEGLPVRNLLKFLTLTGCVRDPVLALVEPSNSFATGRFFDSSGGAISISSHPNRLSKIFFAPFSRCRRFLQVRGGSRLLGIIAPLCVVFLLGGLHLRHTNKQLQLIFKNIARLSELLTVLQL